MISSISPAVQFITARPTQTTPLTNNSGPANHQMQDRVTLSHQSNNASPASFIELKGFGRNDMLTPSEIAAFEGMKKDGNLRRKKLLELPICSRLIDTLIGRMAFQILNWIRATLTSS